MRRVFKKFLLMICVFIILFSFFNGYNIKVNAEDGITPISAGTKVTLPPESEVKQYGCATYEQEDISWDSSTGQYQVNQLWKAGGSLTDENNWAYIKTPDGVNRYLIAVTPFFGNAGDYLDVHIKNGKTIPCVMGDAKGNDSGDGVIGWYMYKDQPIGHKYDNGTCCVLEILLKDYSKTPSQDYLNSLNPVEWIQNGGSCLNGGLPVGLNNTYDFGQGGNSSGTDGDDEAETFTGALNMFFRNLWDSTATAFENSVNNRNDTSVLYDIKNVSGSSGSNSSSNTSIGTNPKGKDVAEYAKSWVGKISYYLGASDPLVEGGQSDCSWFVFHCLNDCGIIDQWYKSTTWGSGGVPGTSKVDSIDKAQPGDILFWGEGAGQGHVVIYVGNKKVVGCNGSSPTTGAVQLTEYKVPGGGREPDSIWRVNTK